MLILARSTKLRGDAAADLVERALNTPGVYFFGELLQIPGIAQLGSSRELAHQRSFEKIQLFMVGTWSDWQGFTSARPPLSAEQEYKLKQLSILSLASQTKVLPYTTLFQALGIDPSDLRQLEDLIIETIYAGLISGKLNQLHSQFEVHHVQGRDVAPFTDEVDDIYDTLSNWQTTTETVLNALETRMTQIKSSAETAAAQRTDDNALLLHNLITAQHQIERQQQSQQQPSSKPIGSAKGKSATAMDIDYDQDTTLPAASMRKKATTPANVRGSKRSRA